MASERLDSDPITLTRYILTEQRKHPEATGDLTIILNAIQTACKSITAAVRRAGLQNLYGLVGSTNVQGEDVKKLDVISNDIFINTLRHTGKIALMLSEENDEPIFVPGAERAHYIAVFDPLDGSSNIDCNVSVGSIFGIYKRAHVGVEGAAAAGGGAAADAGVTAEEALQPGNKLICAGYAMYGSSTQLVITFGDGVNVFTLDPSVGEFLLSHKDVRIPAAPQKIYSCNEGNVHSFPGYVQRFVREAKGGSKPYSLRYVGSMVADVHRTLLYGGVFLYPATAAAPSGKLRLLYECNPMSLIMEQAGGKAVTGIAAPVADTASLDAAAMPGRVLDVPPTKPHQRSPIILGCARDVDILLRMQAEEAAAAAGGGADGSAAAAGAPAS